MNAGWHIGEYVGTIPLEKALIQALQFRFALHRPFPENTSTLDHTYAQEIYCDYKQFPSDWILRHYTRKHKYISVLQSSRTICPFGASYQSESEWKIVMAFDDRSFCKASHRQSAVEASQAQDTHL